MHQVASRYLADLVRDLGCEARGAAMRGERDTEADRLAQREAVSAALAIVEGRQP